MPRRRSSSSVVEATPGFSPKQNLAIRAEVPLRSSLYFVRKERQIPMRLKRLCFAGLVAALALVLSGCSIIESQTVEQRDVIGSAHITTHLCTQDETPVGGCGDEQAGRGQLLVGYEIPWNTAAPATLSAKSDTTGLDLTLTRDQSYTDALEANDPTDDSTNWVGYRSGAYDDPGPAVVRWTIDTDFNLDQEADGSPFTGPFTYATQIGFNDLTGAPAEAETAPLNCAATTPPIFLGARAKAARRRASVRRQIRAVRARTGQRISVFPFGNECFTSRNDGSLDTRDLGIVHLANASVQAGSSVSIPFSVRFKGAADPVATFAISGSSGITGATFTPSQATFAPATDEAKQIDIRVDVPKSAAPGIYPVRIEAALPNGQKRARVAQLWVTPAPAAPAAAAAPEAQPAPLPALVETLDDVVPTSLDAIRKDGLQATIGCNTACVGTVDLLMYKPPAVRAGIARAVDTVLLGRVRDVRIGTDGGKAGVVLQLSEAGRERLGRLRQFTLIVRTTARDVNGQQTPALLRKIRLKPNCAGGEKPCVAR
jgi:hypothetical protein